MVMQDKQDLSPRENFLIAIIQKLIHEYKTLRDNLLRNKLLKIIEISKLSSLPGESEFIIQIANKKCALRMTAAQLIQDNYNLADFSDYHAELVRQAAQGKLIQFLKLTNPDPLYKIIAKKLDRQSNQYIFILENKERLRFERTAEEISKEKDILLHLDWTDIYDIGYTNGMEGILKEKCALALIKNT
jgi:hypothetical protein